MQGREPARLERRPGVCARGSRRAALRAVLAGAARSLATILATVAFGLAFGGLERLVLGPTPSASPAPYPLEPMEPTRAPRDEPEIWLIDGFNVLHAGVLTGRDRAGWWRAASQTRLLQRVACFDATDAELWVVFDAAHEHSERCEALPASSRTKLVFAPSADDWLVRRVRQASEPERLAVVTGDRQVQGRVRHAGARVVSPRAFLARCPVHEVVAGA